MFSSPEPQSDVNHRTMRQLFCGLALLLATVAFGPIPCGADSPAMAHAVAAETGAKSAASGKLSRFIPGDSLALILRDSTRVSGVFLELGRIPLEEYRSRYDDWRANSRDGARLPEIDAPIELGKGITGSGKLYFSGLGHEGMAVRKRDGPTYVIPFDRFSWLYVAGRPSLDSRRLQAISRDQRTPLLTTAKIRVADDTVAVRLDDVLVVQSNAPEGSPDQWTSRYSFSSAGPRTTAAVQLGWLWASNPSDLGMVAHGIYGRVSPTFAKSGLGVDFAFGMVADNVSAGAGGAEFDLALCGAIPMGRALGLAPRAGVGFLIGGGIGLLSLTGGTGVFVRLSRGFGFRTDYTYRRLQGCENCNYHAVSSLQIGPYWGY